MLLWLLTTTVGAQTQAFTIDTISDEVFARMQGRSFPEGCTVKREDLRYLRLLHRNADDSICQGEMVCHKSIAQDLVEIFQKLYEAHYPIERMRLIDDYDADDEASMSDNNSSCFCFRTIAGSTNLSKHARGLAIDINTLYNPYFKVREDGSLFIQPATAGAYCERTMDFPYKIDHDDLCFKLFTEAGFDWGGDWITRKDYQHFEIIE